jgi:hypothetical protein
MLCVLRGGSLKQDSTNTLSMEAGKCECDSNGREVVP